MTVAGVALLALQGAAEVFLPTTLTGWLSVASFFLVTVGSALATTWRFLKKPLLDEIAEVRKEVESECRYRKDADDGVGKRVTDVKDRVTRHEERLHMVERNHELAAAQSQRLERDVGAVTASVARLSDIVQGLEKDRIRDMGEIREKMAEISGKMDLMAKLTNHRGE